MTQGHEQISLETSRLDGPSPNANGASPPPPCAAATPAATADTHTHTQGGEVSPAVRARTLKDYAVTAILALVFGMAGSYAFSHFLDGPPRATDATGKDQADAPENAGPSTRDLGDQVAKLSDKVGGVCKRIDDMPRPGLPPDLSDLQIHVADLTRTAEGVAPLRDAVKRIDDRLEDMSQSIRSLGDELHAFQSRFGGSRSISAGTRTGRREQKERGDGKAGVKLNIDNAPEKPVEAETLKQGAALFHHQKYKEALDFFSKLEQSNPGDARVWYYAALAHGFANNQWTDDGTGSLIEKGLECERAGTPSRPVIDDTFKDLTSATGKDWLATYRKRVNTP